MKEKKSQKSKLCCII